MARRQTGSKRSAATCNSAHFARSVGGTGGGWDRGKTACTGRTGPGGPPPPPGVVGGGAATPRRRGGAPPPPGPRGPVRRTFTTHLARN